MIDGKISYLEMGVYGELRDNETAVKLMNSMREFIDDELALGASKSSIELALDNILRDAKKEKKLK